MIDRLAEVQLQRDGRVYVVTYSKTQDGFRIIDGLPEVVASASDAEALGQATVAALLRSTDGVLPARNLRADPPDAEFLAWTGHQTFDAYAKGVRAVSVWAEGAGHLGLIEVTPQANGGRRSGFTPMDDATELQFESPAQLGVAVQDAVKKATAAKLRLSHGLASRLRRN